MSTLLCLVVSAIPTQPLYEIGPTSTESRPASDSALEPIALAPFTPVVADDAEFPEMEYTFIEGNFVWTNPDSGSSNLDGWEVTGSLELPLNFFLQGTYLDQSSNEDVTRYRIGGGWHFPFLTRFDAYGLLSFAHTELDNSSNDFSEDGYAGEVGLRMLVTKRIEVNGRFLWEDIEDSGSGAGLGARFYLTERLSVGARYDVVDSDDSASAGVRFDF